MNKHTSLKRFTVDKEAENRRLDVFVCSQYPTISRTKIQKCIDEGRILLNNTEVKKRTMLKPGDIVEVDEEALTQASEIRLEPQNIALDILYEDDCFVVVNKPAGMVVHPGSGNLDGTLVNALLYHLESLSEGSEEDRPGIVHRLDKNTSGIIIAAKNDAAHNALADLFASRRITKEYIGFCIGGLPRDEDTITAPIGRKKNDPLRYCVRRNGKEAVTEYKLIAHNAGISLIKFHPVTGRTHQIRVHSSYSGFPVVEDPLYGGGRSKVLQLQPLDRPFAYSVFKCFSRHALHARSISFTHPFTGENVSFEAPLPEDFRRAVELFGVEI
jgi:23S rRNA pseudouridine1911/1915/1917 synthase